MQKSHLALLIITFPAICSTWWYLELGTISLLVLSGCPLFLPWKSFWKCISFLVLLLFPQWVPNAHYIFQTSAWWLCRHPGFQAIAPQLHHPVRGQNSSQDNCPPETMSWSLQMGQCWRQKAKCSPSALTSVWACGETLLSSKVLLSCKASSEAVAPLWSVGQETLMITMTCAASLCSSIHWTEHSAWIISS